MKGEILMEDLFGQADKFRNLIWGFFYLSTGLTITASALCVLLIGWSFLIILSGVLIVVIVKVFFENKDDECRFIIIFASSLLSLTYTTTTLLPKLTPFILALVHNWWVQLSL